MLNRVTLIGRLTADPILRFTHTTQKPVASFSVAVDRRFSKDKETETDFFNIVAWGPTAEYLHRNYIKGQPISVDGRLQQRSYVDEKSKENRYVVEVVAESVGFAGFLKNDPRNAAAPIEDFDPYAESALPAAA